MSLAIRLKMVVLAIGVGLAAGPIWGQAMSNGVRQQGPFSQTVSVLTLQIPARAWKHFDKALSAADHNRPEESEQELTKALEIAPNFAKAYILRAGQELHLQHFDAAIADAVSATKIEPGVLWAAVILAGAYNSTHRYSDARLVLDGLRGPEAETWQAKFERARAEIGSRDVEAALYWSELAIEAAPQNITDVYIVRTNAFLLAKRWEEARSQMKIYLESKYPQTRRNEVSAMLKIVQARIDDKQVYGQKITDVASK